MRKFLFPIAIAMLLGTSAAVATTRKVLFIGNSYTYTNNMPAIVDSIAKALGDTIIYDMSAPGGQTLQQHCTNTTTISKIFSQQWDIVVIHEQSQMPAFPPSQVATDVYPYAHILDSMVHANDSCTQTMFMMTWGHANGDPMNCPGYPVICTYDGMQMRLRESYLQMATDNHADVTPVGSAFKIMVDSAYTPWLFSSDSSHPIVPGSYLQACVVYSSIFHKSTQNCVYTDGLIAADAHLLQRIATKVVFDSLNLWQGTGHYPSAIFTKTGLGSYTFSSHSPVATGHYWSFGDGSHDTAANPHHTYSTGSYVVTHTVTTNCFSETLTDSAFSPVNVSMTQKEIDIINVLQTGNGNIMFQLLTGGYNKMEVYDSRGVRVRQYNVQALSFSDTFAPGMYIYRLYREPGGEAIIGKLGVW